jgi:hypothetical protein
LSGRENKETLNEGMKALNDLDVVALGGSLRMLRK